MTAPDDTPEKAADIEISQVTDGYIVYQPARDRVHYLNQTAAFVFEMCDGSQTVQQLAKIIQMAWELSHPPLEEVADCLASLRSEGLID
jgi:hypothetical protein